MTKELKEAALFAASLRAMSNGPTRGMSMSDSAILQNAADFLDKLASSATTPEAAAQAEGCEPQGDPKSALQWAAARSMAVTKEWARGWDDCRAALATQPVQAQGEVRISVDRMVESVNGVSWWVRIRVGDRWQDLAKYGDRYRNRAEYQAARLRHLFGQADAPDILAYPDPDEAPAPAVDRGLSEAS